MDFLIANANGEEKGFIRHSGVDINVGTENTFEIKIQNKYFDKSKHWYECQFFAPNTEYGGIIRGVNPVTEDGIIKVTGPTWRGILDQQPIYEEANDYLYLNGEANIIIGDRLKALGVNDLFVVSSADSGIEFTNYKVPLQTMFLSGFVDALAEQNARLNIKYIQGAANDKGYVLLEAKPIVDYSDTIEISEDGNVKLNILDYRGGVNHLICLGKGELTERVRVDLFAWPDGSVRKTQYYSGIYRHAQYYENNTTETEEELEAEGREKFADLKNYKQLKISVSGLDLELGDIVGGRERITDITMKSPVVRKILTVSGKGRETMQYKLKGDESA